MKSPSIWIACKTGPISYSVTHVSDLRSNRFIRLAEPIFISMPLRISDVAEKKNNKDKKYVKSVTSIKLMKNT